MNVHPDFLDFIRCLNRNQVEFVLVGAFAVAFHGRPRATGDMDVWIRPTPENATRTIKTLSDFGFASLSLREADILSGQIIQLGRVPLRIDLLTDLSGLSADEVWTSREKGPFEDEPAFYLGRASLIKNKRATGRHKDLADVESLEE